ncbi:MAG: hypothetical protein K8W52_21340 [Deltaproteobacteria bacterium]|nr:hypothetical protein [Deltaproteobacteria bacterium]
MGRGNRILFVLVAAVVLGTLGLGVRQCSTSGSMLPSARRARASVAQILFLPGRVLIRTESSDLVASEDGGRSWRALSNRPETLSIANGGEIWGAHGWPGHHEGPSARLSHSADRGETWSQVEFELPEDRGAALLARLPAAFVQEPRDPPRLLMSDLQLVRPELATNSSTWKRVGVPITGAERPGEGTVNLRVYGRMYRGSIYVASALAIYFSGDEGATWARTSVPSSVEAQIRCREFSCYALLADELMTTSVGANDWRSAGTLALDAVAPVLTADHQHGTLERFSVTAMSPGDSGVYVAGIVDAGKRHAWGAVLLVGPRGALTMVGHGVPEGLWVLEQDPDGTLWAGGQGAYRLQGGEWISAWSASD